MKRSFLHISPTYYSESSVVGGGEKYIVYMSRALTAGGVLRNAEIENSILAFGQQPGVYELAQGIACEVILGRPWDPHSIAVGELRERIDRADVIVVHQCLSAFGLFVASHSKLAHKVVVGLDEGGGEHLLVHRSPEIGRIFDLFHAYSQFCASSFRDVEGRVEIILGPVDSWYYRPNDSITRDAAMVLAVGRIMAHKGFDRIIRSLPSGLRLVIVGTNYDQGYYDYLGSLIGNKRVEVKSMLTDQEVRLLMQTAGLFVHASTHTDFRGTYYAKPELLGLAPLEALSCGTPALVSSAGALPELAAITGCLAFNDDEELGATLRRYAASSQLFPSAHEIHDDVEARYGLEVFGSRFLEAIG
jgi:glycosyltransferase involved in cell wall biosynthesis